MTKQMETHTKIIYGISSDTKNKNKYNFKKCQCSAGQKSRQKLTKGLINHSYSFNTTERNIFMRVCPYIFYEHYD